MDRRIAMAFFGVVTIVWLCVAWSSPTINTSREPSSKLTQSGDPSSTDKNTPSLISKQPDPRSVRADELRRRPQLPTADLVKRSEEAAVNASQYGQVMAGGFSDPPVDLNAARMASLMPATSCYHVERVPDSGENQFNHVGWSHSATIGMFMKQSGFGITRGIGMSRNIKEVSTFIDRVELVGLLLHDEPIAYVLEEMATPPLARVAHRRPLDEFEQRGLEAVRGGVDLVWAPEAPTRMFGAIRAEAGCLNCHPGARENDLLGAFTYYLNVPVDQWNKSEELRNKQEELRNKQNGGGGFF